MATRPKEKRTLPPIRELGAPGTVFTRGFIQGTDENEDWRLLSRRVKIIDEMRKTDAQCQAMLQACKLPILASRWLVKPPEKPSKQEEEHAKFAFENLHGMTNPWVESLSQTLTYFDYGFAIFEKIFRLDEDGKFRWKKWATRHQSTLWKWNVENDGGLRSITQRVWKNRRFEHIELSSDRLLIFVNGKEASNWEGQSLLRSAYKHWYLKDKLYRIDAIAQERHGVGMPKIKLPPGAGDAEMDFAEQILIDMRSHEKGYILEPDGFEVGIQEIPTQLRDPMESIKHHDEKISTSVLAQFLNLGFTQTGSRALGTAFKDFFLAALNTYTAYIAGIINKHAIPQLIDVNFGPQKRYPQLEAVPVAGIDFERMARSLMMLGQNGFVFPDRALIEHIHELFGLPRPSFELDPVIERLKKPAMPNSGFPGDNEKKVGNGNGAAPAGTDDDVSDDRNAVVNRFDTVVMPAIGLQIERLLSSAGEGNKKFNSPFEGTLAQSLHMVSSKDGDNQKLERAAKEYSRRLANAAEMAVAQGFEHRESIRYYIEQEATRSLGVLMNALEEKRVEHAGEDS